ncbi:MAG: DUF4398 domain-containing protein [Elusimicrobia bacterium]|jgi:hypothetical protein|nr:DUF4398 domain-containing protein [Elusimicrobiota bacterium]
MLNKRSIFLSMLSAGVLVAGCAKPPTMEMADAENAIQAADLAGAAEYAQAEWNEAKNALSDARAKLASKDYKAALAGALDARHKAETAESVVASRKEAAKAAAMEIVTHVEEKINSLKAKLPKASGNIKSSLQNIETEWTKVMEEFMNGNYSKVSESASGIINRVEQLAKSATTPVKTTIKPAAPKKDPKKK